MKTCKLFLSASLLFTVLNTAQAQIDLENEIKSFTDSTELIISNGRKMLLQYVQAKDYQKAADIYDFLKAKTSANGCSAFTYNEELYITSLIGGWTEFLTQAAYYSGIMQGSLCYPTLRQETRTLYQEFYNNAALLAEDAQNDNIITAEEKELLDIYFYLIRNNQDAVYDKKMKNFKKKYPYSRYRDFTDKYLPKPRTYIGMSFGLGLTEIFPTGNLNSYFAPATVGAILMDIYFNKLFLAFQFDAGSMKFKTPLLNSTTRYGHDFLKDEELSYMDAGIIGGYVVAQNKRLQFSPYVYLGGISLKSNLYTDGNNEDLEFKMLDSFFIGPGLRTELKLFGFGTKDPAMPGGFLNLRLDIGYNIPVRRFDFSPAQGNILYARLALVLGMDTFNNR